MKKNQFRDCWYAAYAMYHMHFSSLCHRLLHGAIFQWQPYLANVG